MTKNPYDDIIDLPHHVSQVHPQMPRGDRAAQFSAFAALVGFGDIIDETARTTDRRRELDETEKAALNRKLGIIAATIAEKPSAEIEYFVPDGRKKGGEYAVRTGVIAKISRAGKTLTLEDGVRIRIEDIVRIELEKEAGLSGGVE